MSLDHSAGQPNPDDLIQFGRDDAIVRLEALARKEADNGDGRALRILHRLVEMAGLRRRKVRQMQPDDGC